MNILKHNSLKIKKADQIMENLTQSFQGIENINIRRVGFLTIRAFLPGQKG